MIPEPHMSPTTHMVLRLIALGVILLLLLTNH